MAVENPRRTGSFLDDRQSLEVLIESMPEAERRDYESFEALVVEACFPGRRMVVYTLKDGQPRNIEMLFFGDFRTGLEVPLGMVIDVTDDISTFQINPVPTRYRHRDVFLHVPQNFTLKWKGKRTSRGPVEFVPHYAILVKTRSKEHLQMEGDTYCVTFNKFRERFPELDLRY